MTRRLLQWLTRKWQRGHDPKLAQAYQVTFSTIYGQQVLQHLMDNIYCTVYEGKDLMDLAYHNGRRSVIHEILDNLDVAEHPERYHEREMVT
jgi:hypothetical protein